MPLLALTALAFVPAALGQVSGTCEKLDLVFVIDSSGSIRATFQTAEEIEAQLMEDPTFVFFKATQPAMFNTILAQMIAAGGDDHWLEMLDFVKGIVGGLEIGSNKVRVGMVVFSNDYKHEFYLSDYSTQAEVLAAIDGATYLGFSTHTRDALEYAETDLFTAAHGDRAEVPNIAIVVTDGQSNVGGDDGSTDTEATIAAARNLQEHGVSVISVGVTNAIDDTEIEGISSPDHVENTNWFYVPEFAGLVDKVGDILESAQQQCSAMTTVAPATTAAPTTPAPVICTEPTGIPNGGYTVSEYTVGGTTTYTCNSGYEITGTSVLTCTSAGSWSDTPPTCTPNTCVEPEEITNGNYIVTEYTVGSNVQYVCDSGYEITGSSVLTCTEDGTWSDVPPTCTEVACTSCEPALSGTLANGVVVGDFSNSIGSTVTYTCNQLFTMNGPPTITCKDDCTWSDTPPVCDPDWDPWTPGPPQPGRTCDTPCECRVDGDPQVITYDKELVLLTGTGQYTLSKDTLNPDNVCSYNIEVNVADGQVTQNGDVFAMTTSRYLTIDILGVRIILNLNEQAMVGNEQVALPYTGANSAYIIQATGGGLRFLSDQCEIEVQFGGRGTAVISMCRENLSSGQTGLCGTCDGGVNDLQTRDGAEISSFQDSDGNRKYTGDDIFQQISDSYRVNNINDDLDWNSTNGGGSLQPGDGGIPDTGDNMGGGFDTESSFAQDTGSLGGDDLGGDLGGDFGGDDLNSLFDLRR